MKIQLDWSDSFPIRAIKAKAFIQNMFDRIAIGAFRYENGRDGMGHRSQDYITKLKKTIRKYENTGNLEQMIDAANYCMLEFYNSNHPDQHFKCEESNGRNVNSE